MHNNNNYTLAIKWEDMKALGNMILGHEMQFTAFLAIGVNATRCSPHHSGDAIQTSAMLHSSGLKECMTHNCISDLLWSSSGSDCFSFILPERYTCLASLDRGHNVAQISPQTWLKITCKDMTHSVTISVSFLRCFRHLQQPFDAFQQLM